MKDIWIKIYNMHKKTLFFVCGLLLYFSFYSNLNAAATFNINITDVTWDASGILGYNPWDPVEYYQAVNFELHFEIDTDTDYFVTFTTGSAGSYSRQAYLGLEEIQYNLYKNSTTNKELKDLPNAKKDRDVINGTVTLTDTSPLILTYFVRIPAEQTVFEGSYLDTYTVKVYDETVNNPGLLYDQDDVHLTIPVYGSTQIALGSQNFGDSGIYDLDFGDVDLNINYVRSFIVKIRSTQGYNIYVQSENNQQLKHVDPAEGTYLPYVFYFENKTEDLTSGSRVFLESRSAKTNSNGIIYDIDIDLTVTDLKPDGDYADNIIFTITDI